MKKHPSLLVVAITLAATVAVTRPAALVGSSAEFSEDEAIRQVILSAYIEGLHKNASRAAARAGFHPGFYMFVRTPGDSVRHVTIEEWIGRLQPEGTPPTHDVTAEVNVLAREGAAATAHAEVYFDGKRVFTDFFLLYRLEGHWRIVGKIFESHR